MRHSRRTAPSELPRRRCTTKHVFVVGVQVGGAELVQGTCIARPTFISGACCDQQSARAGIMLSLTVALCRDVPARRRCRVFLQTYNTTKTGTLSRWQESAGGAKGYSTSCVGAAINSIPGATQVKKHQPHQHPGECAVWAQPKTTATWQKGRWAWRARTRRTCLQQGWLGLSHTPTVVGFSRVCLVYTAACLSWVECSYQSMAEVGPT